MSFDWSRNVIDMENTLEARRGHRKLHNNGRRRKHRVVQSQNFVFILKTISNKWNECNATFASVTALWICIYIVCIVISNKHINLHYPRIYEVLWRGGWIASNHIFLYHRYVRELEMRKEYKWVLIKNSIIPFQVCIRF